MKCFLCGTEYDPGDRYPVAMVSSPNSEDPSPDPVPVKYVQMHDGRILKLCPACTRAVTLGITLNSDNLLWDMEIEFEETEADSDG